MKLRLLTLLFVFSITTFFSVMVCAGERVFHFKMNHVTITKDIINAYESNTSADFSVCIGDDGYSRILRFEDGMTARLGFLTKNNWTTKTGDVVGINNSGYGESRYFTIDLTKKLLIFIADDTFYMYSVPSSGADFVSEYNKLYHYLKSQGKLTVNK